MYPYIVKDQDQINQKIDEFIEKYEQAFSFSDKRILRDYLESDPIASFFVNPFYAQIYETMGIVKPACSTYYQLTHMIEKYFGLKRDIVEIGGGLFPILADYLRVKQLQIGIGTVTVYDPGIWMQYPTSAKLVKERFTLETVIPEHSLLVGMYPCEATELIVKRAIKENLDFCIALCGCNHSGMLSISTDEYHDMLIKELMFELLHKKNLKVKYFPKSCFERGTSSYPILLAKEKKSIPKIFVKK